MQIVNIDGSIYPPAEAKISVFDHGFLYGDNVYETMRTVSRKIFVVDRHMQRLQNSARMLRLTLPLPIPDIIRELARTVEATDNPECYVRLIVTRGIGRIHLDMDRSERSSFIIIVQPFDPLPAEYYERGIKTALVAIRRNSQMTLNPGIKSGNLLNNVLAYMQAKEQDAFEGILCNLDGYITEGTGSNVFFARNGALCTPPLEAGLLPGVTRGLVLELAREQNIDAGERNITPAEIGEFEECFITGTTKGVLPVREISGTQFNAPGPITARILDAYRRFSQAQNT